MRLIDADSLIKELAREPMNTRTYSRASGLILEEPTVKAIPLDKVKQAREEIYKKHQEVLSKYGWSNLNISLEILDKLIAESEDNK